jgi:hypothetical protein
MRRRSFISLLAGTAAWPLAVRAQQPAVPVIGFLNSAVPQAFTSRVAAYRRGLGEAGFVETRTSRSSIAGRTVNTIDYSQWLPISSAAG